MRPLGCSSTARRERIRTLLLPGRELYGRDLLQLGHEVVAHRTPLWRVIQRGQDQHGISLADPPVQLREFIRVRGHVEGQRHDQQVARRLRCDCRVLQPVKPALQIHGRDFGCKQPACSGEVALTIGAAGQRARRGLPALWFREQQQPEQRQRTRGKAQSGQALLHFWNSVGRPQPVV
jgi:hypothetical protein